MVQPLSHLLVVPMRVKALAVLVMLALLAGCSSAPKPRAAATSTPAWNASTDSSSASSRSTKSPRSTSNYAPLVRTLPPINQDVVFHAISLVGTPYQYGGSTPETGFDCSGLINYVFRQAVGMALPRTTAGLNALSAENPAVGALEPGDLVLFAMNGGNRVNHAGIYVGDGRFLHAPSSGGKVRMDSLQANFWQRTYTGARRVLE